MEKKHQDPTGRSKAKKNPGRHLSGKKGRQPRTEKKSGKKARLITQTEYSGQKKNRSQGKVASNAPVPTKTFRGKKKFGVRLKGNETEKTKHSQPQRGGQPEKTNWENSQTVWGRKAAEKETPGGAEARPNYCRRVEDGPKAVRPLQEGKSTGGKKKAPIQPNCQL